VFLVLVLFVTFCCQSSMIAWDVVLAIECAMNASSGPPVAGVRDVHYCKDGWLPK